MGLVDTLTNAERKKLQDNEADAGTQALREKSMKGKTMLFISGSFLYPSLGGSLKEQLLEIKAWGCTVYMVFQKDKKNDKYYQQARDANCFDFDLFADMNAENAAENIIQAVTECGVVFDGAYTPHEATQPICGKVQRILGLPGNNPEAYEIARDKYRTRKTLEAANLNTAKAVQVWTLADCQKAEDIVGFPMIIKPTVGMGSCGVYRIDDAAQLKLMVTRLLRDIDEDWALAQNKVGQQAPILAETCIVPVRYGPNELISEFDVDCLFWDGELVYANVIDNWCPQAPYFQDRGFNAPSTAPQNIQQSLIDYCAACVKAIGFTRGNFHMEAWYTKSGPVLIECNPRVGGGSVDKTHRRIWGVSPSTNMCLAMMGVPINPPRESKPKCTFGFMLVNAQKTGILCNDSYCDDVKSLLMVDTCTTFLSKGSKVRGFDTGVPDWLAQIDFESKASTEEMIASMETTMAKVQEKAALLTSN